ncbi:MAG: alpha/beta fold hydrolase [Lysobacterales bacterium]
MLYKQCMIVWVALWLVGCDGGDGAGDSVTVDSLDKAPAEVNKQPEVNMTYAPDGVEIHYQVSGQQRSPGDPTLVFIHGWSCNISFWREQLEVFSKTHQVVALDLGGHGQSGIDRGVWRIVGFGDDVAAVVNKLNLSNVVLIGHSMGGPVALASAQRLPGVAKAVIGVDTLHDASLTYEPQQVGQMMAAFQADFSASMKRMFEGLAGPTVPLKLQEWIVAEGRKANPQVAAALLGDFARISVPDLLRDAGVPVRVINAAAGPMTAETKVSANQEYADYDAVIMEGVGHFLQLEQPEAFNQELVQVLEGLASPE